MKNLKFILDALSKEMDSKERINNDPIRFPHRFSSPADIEVAGLIASAFAFGRVDLFIPVLNRLFFQMGESPASFCKNYFKNPNRQILDGIKYRFYSSEDISIFLSFIGKALTEYGSLSALFGKYYKIEHIDIREGLTGFVSYFESLYDELENNKKSMGVKYFFPSPEKGGCCKRLNLFLRWMVRKEGIDFGIWKEVNPAHLIIPLDVHIARIGLRLGLTKRTDTSWKTAKEITMSLAKIDPYDPVKYDFALCHYGISKSCPINPEHEECAKCRLKEYCTHFRSPKEIDKELT